MHKRLYENFVQNNFLVDNEFGFKKHHCTNMAVVRLVDHIATEIDRGNFTVGCS